MIQRHTKHVSILAHDSTFPFVETVIRTSNGRDIGVCAIARTNSKNGSRFQRNSIDGAVRSCEAVLPLKGKIGKLASIDEDTGRETTVHYLVVMDSFDISETWTDLSDLICLGIHLQDII